MPDDIEVLAATLRDIKRDLVCGGTGAQITEAIPAVHSDAFPAPQRDLDMLHMFASENPIYHNSHNETLAGVQCVVYEGDINRYWLGSILHSLSRAPFSPTWVASAYVLVRLARQLGYTNVLDVGSGDGRIAFCSSVLGMTAHGIEIDADLVALQESLAHLSHFEPKCCDVADFDYTSLDLVRPVVFVGGLAQMGGTDLASAVLDRMHDAFENMTAGRADNALHHTVRVLHGDDDDDDNPDCDALCDGSPQNAVGWVLAGTRSPKYAPDPRGMHGWGGMMCEKNLVYMRTIDLPTAWTLDHTDDTPYVFARWQS